MSEYGIIINNPRNYTLIDNEHPVYSEYETGSATLVSGVNSVDIGDVSYDIVSMMQPSADAYVRTMGYTVSSGTKTHLKVLSSGNHTVNYKLYKAGPTAPTPEYGLEIYNSSGDAIFNSDDKLLKLVNIYQLTSLPSWNTYSDITVSSTENYFMIESGGFTQNADNNILSRYMLGFKKYNTTTLRLVYIFYFSSATTYNGQGGVGYYTPKLLEFQSTN